MKIATALHQRILIVCMCLPVGRKLSGGEAVSVLLLFVELVVVLDAVIVVVVLVVLVVALVDVRDARPFALAFRNLL